MRLILYIMLVFAWGGCLDIFTTTSKPVIGNISLINSHETGKDGYYLVLSGNAIINDYATDVVGNDSVLLVRVIKGQECNEMYYMVRHNKGDRPVKTSELEKEEYDSILTVSKYNISVKGLEYSCP